MDLLLTQLICVLPLLPSSRLVFVLIVDTLGELVLAFEGLILVCASVGMGLTLVALFSFKRMLDCVLHASPQMTGYLYLLLLLLLR